MDRRSYRVPKVRENRVSVIGNFVLLGSISSLILRVDFFFFTVETHMGENLRI